MARSDKTAPYDLVDATLPEARVLMDEVTAPAFKECLRDAIKRLEEGKHSFSRIILRIHPGDTLPEWVTKEHDKKEGYDA